MRFIPCPCPKRVSWIKYELFLTTFPSFKLNVNWYYKWSTWSPNDGSSTCHPPLPSYSKSERKTLEVFLYLKELYLCEVLLIHRSCISYFYSLYQQVEYNIHGGGSRDILRRPGIWDYKRTWHHQGNSSSCWKLAPLVFSTQLGYFPLSEFHKFQDP